MKATPNNPFNALSDHLKKLFGCKVFKVTINAGLTCPNRDGTKGYGGCAYCRSEALLPKQYGQRDIESQLAFGIERVRKRHKAGKFIAYYQINTNTHSSTEHLERLYKEAMDHPEVCALAVSTRPDCVAGAVLELLAGLKRKKHLWLELGLQSSNDETLKKINRGHGSNDFKDALERARSMGIDVCAHVILGLPGEGRADWLGTMRFLSRLEVWGVKFHQLQVLKGTALEAMHERGEVRTLGLEEYASLVVECLEMLPEKTVIHRLCADTPKQFLVAPKWGANKFIIMDKIMEAFASRRTFQGARADA